MALVPLALVGGISSFIEEVLVACLREVIEREVFFLTIFVGGIIIATVGGSGGGRMDNNSIEWASV